MTNKDHLTHCATLLGIPDYMQDGLTEYILTGRPVGSFLTAVLSNNLKEACNKADDTNQLLLFNYVKFLYNHAPMGCWGSESNVESWMERGGLVGVMAGETK